MQHKLNHVKQSAYKDETNQTVDDVSIWAVRLWIVLNYYLLHSSLHSIIFKDTDYLYNQKNYTVYKRKHIMQPEHTG